MPTMRVPDNSSEIHGPMYGTAPDNVRIRNIKPSGSQWGLTSVHASPINSHDLNS